MLNCGITEIAESLATKRFILHQRSARAGFQQAQTFFPFTCALFFFFLMFVNINAVPENYSPCPECTSPFIKSAWLKSHHAPGKDNCKSGLTLPVPPECRYYSLSLGKGPHMWVSETTSVTPSIIINSRMNCSWDALRRHGNTRPNLCIHLTGPARKFKYICWGFFSPWKVGRHLWGLTYQLINLGLEKKNLLIYLT